MYFIFQKKNHRKFSYKFRQLWILEHYKKSLIQNRQLNYRLFLLPTEAYFGLLFRLLKGRSEAKMKGKYIVIILSFFVCYLQLKAVMAF